MRLTKNNISYVTENQNNTGKATWCVMMKGHAMSDAKFFENVESVEMLPKAVQEFVNSHNCELLDADETRGRIKYIYR